MKVVPKPKPYSLPKKYYALSQAYAEVVASRFSGLKKDEVSITNWQIRLVEMTFFHSRGCDIRLRVYFPIGNGRNIVVSLGKSAKKEKVIELISRVVEHAKNVDIENFKIALNELITYCKTTSPLLYVEYKTARNYVLQPVKSLKIN